MEWLIIILYGSVLFIICLFSLGQFNLACLYLRSKKDRKHTEEELTKFPFVTVQLPVFNERYVIERLIDAVAKFDYPPDKMEIQVLDDSTDETVGIIDRKARYCREEGINIQIIRRPERTGFKAGALQYGMESANGEFIAIFDADFIPNPDFLLKTLPGFSSPEIGMVQTKWSHLNTNYNLLTRIQAFFLNAHFTVEQGGRFKAGSFINFNGTAGVWRKTCIIDAGGWKHDTLTEDLDLSYRAQLKNWKFVYCEEIESPAELPVIITAVKSQQYRWNKGAAETASRTLGKVLASPIPFMHKIRATLLLLNSSVFLLLLIAAILSIPMLYVKEYNPELGPAFDLGSIFLVGFIATCFFYWTSAKMTRPKHTLRYFITDFTMFLTFSMGMALHNSIAVIEGYLGIKTPFVRTPKFNIRTKKDTWKANKYLKKTLTPVTLAEGFLALYFLYGILSGLKLKDYGLMPFHLMLAVGFACVFLLSVKRVGNA